MPSQLDELIERLKGFEETQLIELLDLTSEDIVERFRDVIARRREYLFGEVEEFIMDVAEEYDGEEYEGYQIEEFGYGDEE